MTPVPCTQSLFFFLNVNTVEADVSNMLTMSIAC